MQPTAQAVGGERKTLTEPRRGERNARRDNVGRSDRRSAGRRFVRSNFSSTLPALLMNLIVVATGDVGTSALGCPSSEARQVPKTPHSPISCQAPKSPQFLLTRCFQSRYIVKILAGLPPPT